MDPFYGPTYGPPYGAYNEWNLVSHEVKRNAIYYQCCPEPYIDITFDSYLLLLQGGPSDR